ncbi:phosphate ABC transporter ATP-binding protein [Epibacterium sp. Ofav1-8]|uniref:phosphate ABC transporter ATP-binding protein n=1 Tax=Epibacterium sp. Ofav1-8 TaxID=2917735 RepID=UPI001EF6BD53|nr:ATP-binding cassette domain-containing protein [Epibacterium sp. Ofav1-8]MCG7624087.1 ATP-binding cassette domain-containing protein [Epibacterium sp. Ofav1-8]
MFHSRPLHLKQTRPPGNGDRDDGALVSFCGFGAAVGGKPVLRDLTFDLMRSEVLGLIGRAGAGKTALLRAMCRLLDEDRGIVTTGRILFEGEDIHRRSCDLPTLRRRLAYMPQEANPFPVSIWDNIAYGVRLNRVATTAPAISEVVEGALRRCLLWDQVKDHLHSLRGTDLPIHQQRQLCLARSIAIQPQVLLLDRPTGSIDRMELEMLNRLVMDLKRDYTLVIVTASLTETAQVADRVAFLDEGQLVEIDTAEMMFTAALQQQTRDFINSTAM